MRDCGIQSIDEERRKIINSISKLLFESCCNSSFGYNQSIKDVKKELLEFRMKLGMNRATEFLEGNFGWTVVFDDLNEKLETEINNS